MIEDTENLNELFSYIMPIEMEKEFFLAIKKKLNYESNPFIEQAQSQLPIDFNVKSEELFRDFMADKRKNNIEYMFAKTAKEKALVVSSDELVMPIIQEVFDLRKEFLLRIPEVERLFLKRRAT